MPGLLSRARIVAWLRQSWPWLVGVVILIVVVRQIPLEAFRVALQEGNHLELSIANVVINVVVLGTDSVSTWIGLLALRLRRQLLAVVVVRGATYLLLALNFAVGQGGFGYYLYRSGVTPLRATGATLFLIGTNLAMLLVLTTAAWVIRGLDGASAAMWWTLVVGCVGFAVYLIVIAIAPAVLARREMLAPLFDAGVRGHLLAVIGRLPHVAALVLGLWVAMRVWGIDVPFATGMTTIPTVVIIAALPISPGGLGTTQAALVYFFSDYAVGATADERGGVVLAFSLVHFVYGLLASTVIGFVCAPFAKREADRAQLAAGPAVAGTH